MSAGLPDIDKAAVLGDPQIGQYMATSMAEALEISSDGWVDDTLGMIEPWGFELSEVKVPLLLYQGSEDNVVPYAHGQWLAEHLPPEKLRKHFLEGQGHISIFLGQMGSMIDELLAIEKSRMACSRQLHNGNPYSSP
jgi:pimeloyl-ACP methyl ester carboxylesterase